MFSSRANLFRFSCSALLIFNAFLFVRVLAFNCEGRQDGALGPVKPGKCHNKFAKCAYGQLFKCQCPDRLFYNEDKEQCDYKTEIVACGGRPSIPKFDCKGLDNGLYAIESCASAHFFSCNGGHTNQMHCSPGLVFDQDKKLCEFSDRCAKKAKTTPATTTPAAVLDDGPI